MEWSSAHAEDQCTYKSKKVQNLTRHKKSVHPGIRKFIEDLVEDMMKTVFENTAENVCSAIINDLIKNIKSNSCNTCKKMSIRSQKNIS